MSVPERYLALRTSLPISEVNFGVGGILLFEIPEIDAKQVGYSVSPDGKSLSGSGQGAWRPNWLVIGCETACGDPLIIDTSDPSLPVLTDVHGQGEWNPIKIAVTLEAFVELLKEFARISVGRANPMEQDQHPLTEEERAAFMSRISALNGTRLEMDFWDALLSC